ncbi:MAG: 6,7-dimethyl-8-ribityllumazine synthase [Gemmatimonadota bacterium]|nr:6,7-dimethyl-8-ribityllumazine synthase [Gemmatimonadota bacterium]MDE2870694.1 6,7-dimethyl-8-ribityllumazine synthase [Gemmatimonadota bacterium]
MKEAGGVGGPRIAFLVSRFNSLITEQMLRGARRRLLERGITSKAVNVLYVPGAWDMPQAARRIADSGRYDAILAIGCVIRGETAHFDYVAGQASDGLGRVALTADIPVVFGVLTTDTGEQAMLRADMHGANKGGEFADAVLDMLELYASHPRDANRS